jgi:hypothetical protein
LPASVALRPPILPGAWIASTVHDSQHKDYSVEQSIVHKVRKAMKPDRSDVSIARHVEFRVLLDPQQSSVKLFKERLSQANALVLIPATSLLKVFRNLRAKTE